jgi:hypothetical protein
LVGVSWMRLPATAAGCLTWSCVAPRLLALASHCLAPVWGLLCGQARRRIKGDRRTLRRTISGESSLPVRHCGYHWCSFAGSSLPQPRARNALEGARG